MNNQSSVIDSKSRNHLRAQNTTIASLNHMSMMSTTSLNSQTFKIFYNDDCKRVSLKLPYTYEDLINKCISIYKLKSDKASYFLQTEELDAPFVINDEDNLNYYVSFQETQGVTMIKLVLKQVDQVILKDQEPLQSLSSQIEQNDSSDVLKIIKNSVSQEAGQMEFDIGGSHITPYHHLVHPQMILKILTLLQERGTVTRQDVQKLSLSNSLMNSEEELAKVTNQDSLNIVDQCEVAIYDILYCNSNKNLVKSEGDITQSFKSTNATTSERIKLQQSINEAELKLSQLQEKESLISLKRTDQKKLKKQQYNNNSFRYSFQGSMMQSGLNSHRARTNSGQFETPRGQSQMRMSYQNKKNSNNSFNNGKDDQIIQQQHQLISKQNQDKSKQDQNIGQIQQFMTKLKHNNNDELHQLLNQNKEDDNISLISSDINTILEKNESMEISMILNESNINQSYYK